MERLSVTLSYPVAAFHEVSGQGLAGRATDSYASYSFDLRGQTVPAPIHIAFGFRPRDLQQAGLIALGFVLVPILIILWMRRVTLRGGVGKTPSPPGSAIIGQ